MRIEPTRVDGAMPTVSTVFAASAGCASEAVARTGRMPLRDE